MVINSLPDWLKHDTIDVQGLQVVISSNINLDEKKVSFEIHCSGWLTTATCGAASTICDSLKLQAQAIKFKKEQLARSSGWSIISEQDESILDEELSEAILLAG